MERLRAIGRWRAAQKARRGPVRARRGQTNVRCWHVLACAGNRVQRLQFLLYYNPLVRVQRLQFLLYHNPLVRVQRLQFLLYYNPLVRVQRS